ncbi:sterol desaturase family protein [Archangium violaceum]|uniref:sterol desaturase family protein n=1 Tax=Archangium violaceum TaxID=83451 RepID=UPI00193C6F96|nr:sterol desaturase family protein [Archangium violaceum]QRK10827.1 sterol desaturase family protein [Archangium violaceum]
MDGSNTTLHTILAMYQEERFFFIAVCSTLLSITAFLAFALPWTWVAYKNPESLKKYRVQGRDFPVRRWFVPSLQRFAFNNLVSFMSVLVSWPLLRLSGIHSGELPPWYVIVGQIAFFIVLDDFLYYWMHRALHTRWLYKHIHSVHHRITTPFALTGNYMHAVEFMLTSTLVMMGPALVGAHVVTLWAWIVFRQLEAADGHSGYDVPWNPALLVPFYKGPVYHDFHHRRFFGNYAGFFSYLDKLFGGTYSKGYEEYRRAQPQPQPPPQAEPQPQPPQP